MIWFWLACGLGEDIPSGPVSQPQQMAPSEQALAGINYIQEKQATTDHFEHVQVWDPQKRPESVLLATLFNGSLVQKQSNLKPQSLLLVVVENGMPLNMPSHPNTVAILKGEWSEKSKGQLVSRTIGLASMNLSTKRYCDVETASLESQVSAVALDVSTHFSLPLQVSKALQSVIDVGLWGRLNPDWLSPDASDVRQRWTSTQVSSNPLERLVGFRYGYTPEQIRTLTQDEDPWIRAQAVRQAADVADVGRLIEDDSSLVRVTAGHRLGELLREDSTETGCLLARTLTRSTDAYVRWKGAYALRFCQHASTELVRLFSDVDIDVQREAVLSIQYHADVNQHTDSIRELTLHKNSFVRRWAWTTIANLAHPEVHTMLEDCLQSESALLAKEACSDGLNRLGVRTDRPTYLPPRASDVQDVSKVRTHPDPTFRKDAAKFLVNAAHGEPLLSELMQDSDGEVRKTAVEALGFRQSPLVWDGLQDSDPDVIVTALEAIRIGRVTGDLEIVRPFLSHPDTEIRLRAVEVWTTFANQLTESQRETLQSLVRSRDERIRAAIVMEFPTWVSQDEPSMWVRLSSVRRTQQSSTHWPDDAMIHMYQRGKNEQAWVDGLIQQQDDLVHEMYSWNHPSDKPQSHRALRPPRFAPYGHPNRG